MRQRHVIFKIGGIQPLGDFQMRGGLLGIDIG
jgi:hypothetical protein